MSRLLVAPKHDPGPLPNGRDNCYARIGGPMHPGGMCPGLKTAEWLNSLGNDEESYGALGYYRNIDVRLNWLGHCDHIVAKEPEVARLKDIIRKAERELADAKARLLTITGEEA